MRASVMGVTLLIAVAAFQAAQTPFQHVTVALFIFLYCAIRYVGLSVIERSELVMQARTHPGHAHAAARGAAAVAPPGDGRVGVAGSAGGLCGSEGGGAGRVVVVALVDVRRQGEKQFALNFSHAML